MRNNTTIIFGILESYEEKSFFKKGIQCGIHVNFNFKLDDGNRFVKTFYLDDLGSSYDTNYIQPMIEQAAYMIGVTPTLSEVCFDNFIGEEFILILQTRESTRGQLFTNVVGAIPITNELRTCF